MACRDRGAVRGVAGDRAGRHRCILGFACFRPWTDATKWSTNPAFPSDATDNAMLSVTGSSYTVTLSSSESINDISVGSSTATLYQSGGTLTLGGAIDVSAGTYQLYSGTLIGGEVQSSGGTVILGGSGSGPTISGVTLAGTITTKSKLNVTNGLTLDNATLDLTGSGNQVLFNGSQAVSETVKSCSPMSACRSPLPRPTLPQR